MKTTAIISFVAICIASAFTIWAIPDGMAQTSPHSITLPSITGIDLKPGEGKDKTENYCIICHSLDYITTQPRLTASQWTATVNKMIKVLMAFSSRMKVMGQERVLTIEKVEHNVELPADRFALPAEIKALIKK